MAKAKKSKAKTSKKAPKAKAVKKKKKAAKAVKAKAPVKKSKAVKAKPAKKAKPVPKAKKTVAKKAAPKKTKQIVGEGDYAATRKFDKEEAAFVKKNRAKIPALAKAAEEALEGPEGDSLREADASSKAHAAPGSEV
jgi:hypothetical protein